MSSPRNSRPYKQIVKSLSAASAVALGAMLLAMALCTVTTAQMVMDVDHEMQAAKTTKKPAYTIVSCGKNGQQSLPAGDYNSDLHVDGPCVADGTLGAGTYKYHWVFIHSGGTLTFQDKQLDLYAWRTRGRAGEG